MCYFWKWQRQWANPLCCYSVPYFFVSIFPQKNVVINSELKNNCCSSSASVIEELLHTHYIFSWALEISPINVGRYQTFLQYVSLKTKVWSYFLLWWILRGFFLLQKTLNSFNYLKCYLIVSYEVFILFFCQYILNSLNQKSRTHFVGP